MLAGGAAVFCITLWIYGMVRKDKPADVRPNKIRLTEDGGGADAGGVDGHEANRACLSSLLHCKPGAQIW